jgi:RimJ/RimL family protein N-acetyltransferase
MTLYAFDKLECDRAQVMHNEENVASRRVIEKAGFRFEGTLRNCTAAPSPEQRAGGYVASRRSLLWALLPEDLVDLPWVAPLRGTLRYVNMLGHAL